MAKKEMNWLGPVAGLAGQALGLLGQKAQDKRQLEQQGKLNEMAYQTNRRSAENQKALDLQMWKDTNYSAQIEEAKKAGMSISSLYGGSGASGATVGGGAGASIGAGSATDPSAAQGMQINSARAAAELALLGAQKENIEADTDNKRSGVPVNETKAEGQEIANTRDRATMSDEIKQIAYEAEQQVQETQKAFNERKISDATYQDTIKRIRNEAIGSGIDNEVKRLGMNLDRRKVNAIEQAIQQGWDRLILEKREVTVKELAQAAQQSYMKDSKNQRDAELTQREWEAIGNFALGAAGSTKGMGTMRTTSQTIGTDGTHSVTNSKTTKGW